MPKYHERRATARLDLSIALHRVGDNRDAQEAVIAAIVETQRLVDSHPIDLSEYEQAILLDHMDLKAVGQIMLGRVLSDLGSFDVANSHLGEAFETFEALAANDSASTVDYRPQIAACHTALGLEYWQSNEMEAAPQSFFAARDAFQSLLADGPNNDHYKDGLARVLTYLAELNWQVNEQAQASSYYKEAIKLRRSIQSEPEHRYALVRLLTTCKDSQQADAQQSVTIAAELVDDVPENPRYQTALGAAYFCAGETTKAIEVLEEVDDLKPQGGTEHEFWLALAFAKRGGEQNENRAANRLESAVLRMELEAPTRQSLVLLRDEVESILKAVRATAD